MHEVVRALSAVGTRLGVPFLKKTKIGTLNNITQTLSSLADF